MELDLNQLFDKYHPLALEAINKVETSNEEERILDIDKAIRDALQAKSLANTETDRLTFGEYTRRYDRATQELNELLKDGGA